MTCDYFSSFIFHIRIIFVLLPPPLSPPPTSSFFRPSLSLSSQKEIDVITKSYVSTVCEARVTHNYVGLRWRLVIDLRRQQLQPSEPTAVCTVPTPRPVRPTLRREVSLSLDQGVNARQGGTGGHSGSRPPAHL